MYDTEISIFWRVFIVLLLVAGGLEACVYWAVKQGVR